MATLEGEAGQTWLLHGGGIHGFSAWLSNAPSCGSAWPCCATAKSWALTWG